MSDRPWRLTPTRPPSELRPEDLMAMLGATQDLLADPAARWLLLRAAVAVFAEHEATSIHEPVANDRMCALFGVTSFEQGSLVPALREMLQDKPPAWREAMDDFHSGVAATTAQGIVHSGLMGDHAPSVNLVGDTVMFDGNYHRYELPPVPHPRVVLDYGPGLGMRFILEEHFLACARGRPFHYIPVSQTMFPNLVAMMYLMERHGADAVNAYRSRGWMIERADGMLAATTEMLSTPIRGKVDLIFCSGMQMAARPELETGIANAFPLLRSGGALLIRSQKLREPAESSTVDDMLAIAYRAGFSEPRFFDSISTNRKPVVTAIFTKR